MLHQPIYNLLQGHLPVKTPLNTVYGRRSCRYIADYIESLSNWPDIFVLIWHCEIICSYMQLNWHSVCIDVTLDASYYFIYLFISVSFE